MVALHRAAFRHKNLKYTIFASPKVEQYLSSLITYPQWQREDCFLGAWQGDVLVGYAHFKSVPPSWHLNNIAVLPERQGSRIGSALLDRWLYEGRRRGFRKISVHVEQGNARARHWYEKQGLSEVGATWTYEKQLNETGEFAESMASLELRGWENSEAWQNSYGFSRFRLAYKEDQWDVERLAAHFFRVRKPLPHLLIQALSLIEATRTLLLLSNKPIEDPSYQEVSISVRMQGSLT